MGRVSALSPLPFLRPGQNHVEILDEKLLKQPEALFPQGASHKYVSAEEKTSPWGSRLSVQVPIRTLPKGQEWRILL